MNHDNFRIAWSVAWGVVAVLLCALWVRSYSSIDILDRVNNTPVKTSLAANSGIISIVRRDLRNTEPNILGLDPTPHDWWYESAEPGPPADFICILEPTYVRIVLPIWLPVLLLSALTALPWLRLRFSLRTLLIATTLIAAALGAVVYSVK
jgi:hypothetical protein